MILAKFLLKNVLFRGEFQKDAKNLIFTILRVSSILHQGACLYAQYRTVYKLMKQNNWKQCTVKA